MMHQVGTQRRRKHAHVDRDVGPFGLEGKDHHAVGADSTAGAAEGRDVQLRRVQVVLQFQKAIRALR